MCGSAIKAVASIASIGAAGLGIIQGEKAAKEQKKAANQSALAAAENARKQEEQMNKVNARKPNYNALTGNTLNSSSPTILTGVGGISPASLAINKPALLGN